MIIVTDRVEHRPAPTLIETSSLPSSKVVTEFWDDALTLKWEKSLDTNHCKH